MQTTYTDTMAVGFPGMKATNGDDFCVTARNTEASAEIPFGVVVKRGSTSDRTAALLPTTNADELLGVAIYASHHADQIDLGNTGLKPGVVFSVMRRGRVLVKVEEAVLVGDRAFVRFAAGAGGTQLGSFRKSADTATAVMVRGAVYRTAAAIGGIAEVEVDFLTERSHAAT